MTITERARRLLMALIVVMMAGVALRAQQDGAAQLVVSSAVPDAAGLTLTIAGSNFGSHPLVTLDLIPVNVQFAMDSRIVVVAPVGRMPAGTYLLTVSRGPSPVESGSLSVRLGGPPQPGSGSPAVLADDARVTPRGMEPAARVGDQVITVEDVDREWRRTDPAAFLAASRQLYEGRRRVLSQMIADRLLSAEAASRGTTVEALLAEEIPKRTIPMPDAAVTSLYQELGNQTRGATLDQMRPAIRAWLAEHTEPEMAKMNYIEELTKVSTRAETLLDAPRVQVERAAQDVVLGPSTAPVEIVAFGDFESLDYARFAQSFEAVRGMFGDRVRIVFKHMPALGPESVTLAEAAACAQAQQRFWPFHDAVLKERGTIGARVKTLAGAAGVDQAAFDACVDNGETRQMIRDALDEAARYGIGDSPRFLVNGRLAPDPPAFLPPLEFFKRIIEEELLRQTRQAAQAGRH
jgi:protein-disulfide isomerase